MHTFFSLLPYFVVCLKHNNSQIFHFHLPLDYSRCFQVRDTFYQLLSIFFLSHKNALIIFITKISFFSTSTINFFMSFFLSLSDSLSSVSDMIFYSILFLPCYFLRWKKKFCFIIKNIFFCKLLGQVEEKIHEFIFFCSFSFTPLSTTSQRSLINSRRRKKLFHKTKKNWERLLMLLSLWLWNDCWWDLRIGLVSYHDNISSSNSVFLKFRPRHNVVDRTPLLRHYNDNVWKRHGAALKASWRWFFFNFDDKKCGLSPRATWDRGTQEPKKVKNGLNFSWLSSYGMLGRTLDLKKLQGNSKTGKLEDIMWKPQIYRS